jgi:ABC-type thiamine transport system ATPase subunit
LRVVRASFARDGYELLAPFDLVLAAGESAELAEPSARAASLAARIVGGIVKPTSGEVYVGDFDTRLQPAQAKRAVAFVPANAEADDDFARSLDLGAALHAVARAVALRRANEIFALLGRGGYARAAALALVHEAALIVLDQPPPGVAEALAALRPAAALIATRVASGSAPTPEREAPGLEIAR